MLNDLLLRLESSTNPVAGIIHKGTNFKVLALAFKKGMVLKEHKTALPAKLTVLSGNVIYRQGELERPLQQFGETDIPVNVVHSVECVSDALCLLTQG